MLIRLLPNPPHPSVLFNIIFDDLPEGLALPQTWTTHLSNLMHDELPLPRYQHALDKASVIPCILDEVVFDVPALLVTCRFIDGTVEQWKIDHKGLGAKFLKTLEDVIDDVCLSTLETEREKQREKEREWERERERLRLLQNSSPSSSIKSSKHKKKRSLLMTIVSSLSSLNSIINLSLPSPTIPALSSPSVSFQSSLHKAQSNPSFSSLRSSIPPPPDVCPRFLRRRARSALVDAFRLYVLRELNERVPQGGYYVWILHSLLNDARERRNELLAREREMEREREREREQERLRLMGPPPPYLPQTPPSPDNSSVTSTGSGSPIIFGRGRSKPRRSRGPCLETDGFSAITSTEPPNSDDEEELQSMSSRAHGRDGSDETHESDNDTVETDTDGCSIQTPTSDHFTLPLAMNLPLTMVPQYLPSLVISGPGTNPSGQIQPYLSPPTPTDFQIQNLTHLILLHTSHSARTEHDENTRLEALELRGRRRSWLNRTLCSGGSKRANSSAMQSMKIGVGASYSGLSFSVPVRRSTLGMWVVNAEDLEVKEAPRIARRASSGQVDAIMLEAEDIHLGGGERFSGYDERNGIESKRHKVVVPSRGALLFPVNEVDEEDEMDRLEHSSGAISRSPDSAEYSDDDDNASVKFGNLELHQYDDLRELQMDLEIITGVGFEMDSSDEEDDPASHISLHNARNEVVEGVLPEGGIRVALDIPRPKALHARSAHLLPGKEQRNHQRILGPSCNQGHSLHQYRLQDALPERCHTPLPQLSSSHTSFEPLHTLAHLPAASPGPGGAISVPQPVHFRPASAPPVYTTGIPNLPSGTIPVRSTNKDSFDPTFRPPSRATVRDLESGFCLTPIQKERNGIPKDACVNEMGELISRMETVGLGEHDGEEFTLAMDLPSKLLSSRFGKMSFAAMGQTASFKGRTRGASRVRTSRSEESMSVVVEDTETDAAWV